MDEIIPLDLDKDDNMYFDISHTWVDHIEPQIDSSLHVVTELPAPTISGRTVVTVPEQLAEISGKLLVYLAQIVDIPEISKEKDEGPTGEMTSGTSEEMEDLEPIMKGSPEPPIPSMIDGVSVNKDPRSMEIKNILDLRRIDSSRKTFYLARTIDGIYYWFPSRRTYRDRQLHRSIRAYRRKSQAEVIRKKKHGVKKIEEWKNYQDLMKIWINCLLNM